jgi:hypothetical protein
MVRNNSTYFDKVFPGNTSGNAGISTDETESLLKIDV